MFLKFPRTGRQVSVKTFPFSDRLLEDLLIKELSRHVSLEMLYSIQERRKIFITDDSFTKFSY